MKKAVFIEQLTNFTFIKSLTKTQWNYNSLYNKNSIPVSLKITHMKAYDYSLRFHTITLLKVKL